ncbi:MAG: class I SAM-dependent methyltransferase [Caulobacteraceae bacterium]|nr:class I SAM-dependent methyltransferase [Caulobacteraceae bacterium]
MGLTGVATRAVERGPLPDALTRLGVGYLVRRAARGLEALSPDGDAAFAAEMLGRPIAENTQAANTQHYEVPAAFFRLVLGPRLKYSSGLYETAASSLAQAEDHALAQTCLHADLADGQEILELGCGWGSLSLWMARRYPSSGITAVSNSHSQRAAIEAEARARGLTNLTVITADMNHFHTDRRYDRVVSVEMFEHMANWRELLGRIAGWMAPGGRLFVHIFTHRDRPYRFDATDDADWIARHFFTGGMMPSHGLIRCFGDLFEVEAEQRWSGEHYRHTAEDWLANFDAHAGALTPVLRETYGAEAGLWRRRWRLFFLATAGLFGAAGGEIWGVSHYRLKAAA